MGDIEELLIADAQRREAMISGNSNELANLLGDDLAWAHSPGKTDDKGAILASIDARVVIYPFGVLIRGFGVAYPSVDSQTGKQVDESPPS